MEELKERVLGSNNPFGSQSLAIRNLLARVAVYYCFILEGSLAGVWGRYIPEIQDAVGLSDSLLGTSVLFYYLGNCLAAPMDAFFVKRFGSRVVTSCGAWGFILAMPLVGLAGDFGSLTGATLAFGLFCGIMDISMNSSAILTEIVASIPLLGSFHGSYSIAAALGALMGGVFVQIGLSTFYAFLCCAGVAMVGSLSTFYNMYDHDQEIYLTSFNREKQEIKYVVDERGWMEILIDSSADEHAAQDTASPSTPLLQSEERTPTNTSPLISPEAWRPLLQFAAIGSFASFGESSVVTWSTVYFEREIHANSVVKSLGLTCFMVCMGIGRFLCDYLRRKVGRGIMMRMGGFLAMTGLVIAVLATALPCSVVFACLGFGCTGLGLSTIIPTAFSSAGHLPGVHGGTAVALVAGCTYAGSIVASPLIGLLSDAFGSLRLAILCDGLLLGLIVPISVGILPEAAVFQDETVISFEAAQEDRPDEA